MTTTKTARRHISLQEPDNQMEKAFGVYLAPRPTRGKGFVYCDAFIAVSVDTDVKTWRSQKGVDPHPIARSLQEDFAKLVDRWHDDTDPLSVESEIVNHPAYWRIVAEGKSIVPYILHDLETRGGLWYRALEAIEGFKLPPGEECSDLRKMKEAWLAWGRDQQLIS